MAKPTKPEKSKALDQSVPEPASSAFADTLIGWKVEEKLSRIVDHAELFHPPAFILQPSRASLIRYIHTSDAETYRPIAEIVEEPDAIEAEAKEIDKAQGQILKQLGI